MGVQQKLLLELVLPELRMWMVQSKVGNQALPCSEFIDKRPYQIGDVDCRDSVGCWQPVWYDQAVGLHFLHWDPR